jgi:hypothetical protein
MGSVLSLVIYMHELKHDKKEYPYHIFEPRETKGQKANTLSIEQCSTKTAFLQSCDPMK